MVLCKGKKLELSDIPSNEEEKGFRRESAPESRDADVTASTSPASDGTLADMEREAILLTLAREGGNRTATADKLGISVRTLRNKLALYGKMDAFK